MDYRSDGIIAIEGTHEEITVGMAALMLTGGEAVRKTLTEEFKLVDHGKNVVLGVQYEGWKMYPTYTDVAAMHQIYEFFRRKYGDSEGPAKTLRGAWIRIGEEEDDIKSKGFGKHPSDIARVVSRIDSDVDFDAKDVRKPLSSPLE